MKILLLIALLISSVCWSQSPGGVSTTNLKLWTKANVGVSTSGSNVTGWTDQAAVNTFTVTGTPVLVSSGLNYNPTIQFNGSSRFTGNTTINNTTQGFAVGKIVNGSGVSGSGALIGNSTDGSGDYFFHTEGGKLYAGNPSVYTGYNTTNTLPFNVYSEDFGKTPAASDIIRINGANTVNNVGGDPVPYSYIPTLGSRSTENIINGSELAETILYNASLSSTNVSKIESYLAIKYGITLNNSGGGTAGDYTSSAGTTVWDASVGSAYHNAVIGIARDDNSGLLQKQSHQSDDSTRIYLSSLQTTNAANTGTFSGDGQFVMIGNNAQPLKQASGDNEFPTGMGIYSRISREWKITNTNFDGTFSLDIKPNTSPITASDLRILIDDDGDFTNATMYSPTITYSGGVISVSGISTAMIPANSTKYLAIVSMSSATPLPVGLSAFSATVDNKLVHLNWQTVSENNNDYFAIERSKNSSDWQEIGRVNGAGNSSQLLSYSFTDADPLEGVSYYRLKQTDNDGGYTYSAIRSVNIDFLQKSSLHIYPNPATNEILLEADAMNIRTILIYDAIGRNMNNFIKAETISNTQVRLNLTGLPSGLYYIKVGTASGEFSKY